ncbi:MAG: hypothetical protein AB1742_05135 [bacterium]
MTALVCFFLLIYRVSPRFRWGFLIGSACGTSNLYFLKMVITSFVTPGKKNWTAGITGAALLHAAVGVFLYAVYLGRWSPWALLTGFSLFMLTAFLKAAGMAITQRE